METIEKKGFIRERSPQEKTERNEKIKRLSKSLLTAMERAFGGKHENVFLRVLLFHENISDKTNFGLFSVTGRV